MNAFLQTIQRSRVTHRVQFAPHATAIPVAIGKIERRRKKLWEFAGNLHCSIIGTCLTVADLRKIVRKCFDGRVEGLSEHELHQRGVSLAGVQGGPAKLLQKTLDANHERTLRAFAAAAGPEEVLAHWQEAKQKGDVAGGYWAALTHPDATPDVIRAVFGDVHMLSHLVGAANRADIRKLAELEEQNQQLQEKVERQQSRLRAAVVERDEEIRRLQGILAARLGAAEAVGPAPPADDETASLRQLVGKLQNRISRDAAHGERLRKGLEEARAAQMRTAEELRILQTEFDALAEEKETVESLLIATENFDASDAPPLRYDGVTLLYVGGATTSVGALRQFAESAGFEFLHHDGGHSEAMGLLHGLVARADIVVFPVTCVSHAAMHAVKKLCRQADKTMLPLRGGGIGSLLHGLQRASSSGGPAGPLQEARPSP